MQKKTQNKNKKTYKKQKKLHVKTAYLRENFTRDVSGYKKDANKFWTLSAYGSKSHILN